MNRRLPCAALAGGVVLALAALPAAPAAAQCPLLDGPWEGAEIGDRTGASVSMSAGGEVVLIGEPERGDNGTVRVLQRDDQGAWTEGFEIPYPGNFNDLGARFGESVAVSADGLVVVIGAPSATPLGGPAQIGAAFAMQRANLDLGFVLVEELVDPAPQTGAGFGHRVALSNDGNTAAIARTTGLFGNPGPADVVFVAERADGSVWSAPQPLPPVVPVAAEEQLGSTLAIDPAGDTIAAGTVPTVLGDCGAVHVWERTGGSFVPAQELTHQPTAFGCLFGADAIAFAGGELLVGDSVHDGLAGAAPSEPQTGVGAVWRHVRAGGQWVKIADPLQPPPAAFAAVPTPLLGAALGSGLGGGGDHLAVGASAARGPAGFNAGAVHHFVRQPTGWVWLERIDAPIGNNGGFSFGRTVDVSASGGELIVGDEQGGPNGFAFGRGHLYESGVAVSAPARTPPLTELIVEIARGSSSGTGGIEIAGELSATPVVPCSLAGGIRLDELEIVLEEDPVSIELESDSPGLPEVFTIIGFSATLAPVALDVVPLDGSGQGVLPALPLQLEGTVEFLLGDAIGTLDLASLGVVMLPPTPITVTGGGDDPLAITLDVELDPVIVDVGFGPDDPSLQYAGSIDFDEIIEAPCPGDVNGDGTVEFGDVLATVAAWGPCPAGGPCPADGSGDGTVDFDDLLAVLAAWGPCPDA